MRTVMLWAAMAAVCLPIRPALAQDKDNVNADDIIRKFAAKEAEFREARNNYTYRQTVKMEELEPVGGKWEEIDDIIFTPAGKRSEVVIWAPVISLRNIILTPEDTQDLRDVQPFVLTTEEIGLYNVNYLGREKLDEVGCFTFSVKPKKMEKGKRYFEGEIWVDDRDMQIVKTYGRGVGLLKSKNNLFPKFETYRQQVDGKYWFPTYTRADDTLYFAEGPQRIREIVKYEDYKQFRAESQIKYGTPVENPKPPEPKKP